MYEKKDMEDYRKKVRMKGKEDEKEKNRKEKI